MKHSLASFVVILVSVSCWDASAEDDVSKASVIDAGEASFFEDLWDQATLYENKDNPFIQEFKLRGLYHGQYHWLDSNQGEDNDWEDRRFRFGFESKLFHEKIIVRVDADGTDGFDPLYGEISDAYIRWMPDEILTLTVGKQKTQIGYYDWLQSVSKLPTFERSQLFNQLEIDRAMGAVAALHLDEWTFQFGIYSNDVDPEFGEFDGGIAYGFGAGYDFSGATGLERSEVRVDWLHSQIEEESTILNRHENLFSGTVWLEQAPWGLVTEAFVGSGGAPDFGGFYIQPTFDLLPGKVQLAGRYTFSTGDGPESVLARSRYEGSAPLLIDGGQGDAYHAGYLGLQYFIHGDKLKLMAGTEYVNLSGSRDGGELEGWTYLAGVRLSF